MGEDRVTFIFMLQIVHKTIYRLNFLIIVLLVGLLQGVATEWSHARKCFSYLVDFVIILC